MNYVNYDRAIIQKLHVKLVGWPEKLNFTTPHLIYTVDDARLLRHCLREKTCHWVKLSNKEVVEHFAEMIAKERNGGIVGRKRKTRSDKGVIKKQAITARDASDADKDNSESDPHENENADQDADENTRSKARRSQRLKDNAAHRPSSKKHKSIHHDADEFDDLEPATGSEPELYNEDDED